MLSIPSLFALQREHREQNFPAFENGVKMMRPISSKGACKYYISTLGVGGGSEGNAYFAFVVRGRGGSSGKMLILLM